MWLITTNDRKLVPVIYRNGGLPEEFLTAQEPMGYGAAMFTSGGEVLTLKRPVAKGAALGGMIDDMLRPTRVLGHLQPTPDGIFRPQNTQPYRHKGWVFAMSGDEPAVAPEPRDEYERDFLERNVRGTTVREVIGNLIVARMFRQGVARLLVPAAEELRDAILEVTDPLLGDDFDAFTITMTSELAGVVLTRKRPVSYRTVRRVRDYAHLNATVVVDVEAGRRGWKQLPEGKVLAVDAVPPARVV